MISKDKALDIVGNYLGNNDYNLTVYDGLNNYPSLKYLYGIKLPNDAWYIHVFDPKKLRIGQGRAIGVCKEKGEIIYDGGDCGE